MVLRSIERIKEVLPELLHVVMFYDDGTVFQTTFAQPINIPKLGENLAESLKHITTLLEICQLQTESYTKLIYETGNIIILVLKLGEQSNLALFFPKGEEPKISTIRRFLYQIEKLIDTDKIDLDKHTLEDLKKELSALEHDLETKLTQIEQKKLEVSNVDAKINKVKEEMVAKQKDLHFEDEIHEKMEKIIETKKEDLEQKEDKETKEQLKQDIKEEEKSLITFKKGLEEAEKEMEKMKANIKDFEDEKEEILKDITVLLEDIKKIKDKIATKSVEISTLEEKIQIAEKEKFEKKFFE